MKEEINGYENEYEFVKYLNGRKIKELHPLIRKVIDYLYPKNNEETIIKCWKNHTRQKTDIFIKVNGIMKEIGIKKGSRNSVHVERISDFIHFLIENKVSREGVIEYLKYHYADGTTNGKGKLRQSVEKYKQENQDKIDMLNKELNNKKLVEKAIERFVLKGNNSNYQIDAIIIGTISDFVWASKENIKNIILSKMDTYSTAVHFGCLTCQPKNRCLNYNPLYEKDRFCVQIKWYSLFDDIISMMNTKEVSKNKI